jgi:hypothetical protein
MTAIQEGLWLVSFFGCIKLLLTLPLRLFADNPGAIALSKDAANHTRTVILKHIDFRYHCIHSHIETGMFSSQRLFTHRNTANILQNAIPVHLSSVWSLIYVSWRECVGYYTFTLVLSLIGHTHVSVVYFYF